METEGLQAELKRVSEPILAMTRQLAKEMAGKDDQLNQLEMRLTDAFGQLAE